MNFNRRIDIVLLAFAFGCADSGTAPIDDVVTKAVKGLNYVEEGEQNPPPGVPPEYAKSSLLISVDADAGHQPDGGFAYASAIVRYAATNVLARATVTTKDGSRTEESQDWHFFPLWERQYMVTATYPMTTCSGQISGQAYGKVWNQAQVIPSFTIAQWGEKSKSDTKDYSCPSPPPTQGGSSGGGGGGGSCHTIAIDHYWYYPDTGEVQYRYTEYQDVCGGQEEI